METPVTSWARSRLSPPPYRLRRGLLTMGNYLDTHSRSLRRRERRPSYAHTAAPVLGPRAFTPGVAATIQARRSTCLLLRALQRRRVESLVLGALSSSPVHRALVLVLGTSIAVLLDCSKSSRQCSLSYLLTYLPKHRPTATQAATRSRSHCSPDCSAGAGSAGQSKQHAGSGAG